LVFSNHVHPDKNVFIIDISVPGSVDESVKKKANVEFCQEASSVYLPMNPDFAISTHTPIGKIFCCGAEAILAGLYDLRTSMKGHLNENQIKLLMNLAIQEGMFENLVYANNL
jgi:hypothetical protein